ARAINHDARELGEPRLDGEQRLKRVGALGFEIGERHGIELAEGADTGASERGDMAVAGEKPAEVAGDGAHIRALAALRREDRRVRRDLDKIERMDRHLTRLDRDSLAVAGEIVGALAGNLYRGERRRRL